MVRILDEEQAAGPNGGYLLDLPNGTVALTASHGAVGEVQYGVVRFTVAVNGGAPTHDLTIPRSAVPLTGAVVDAATGRPVGPVAVALWSPAGRAEANGSTTAGGTFGFAVAPGAYNVSVTVAGYEPANVTVVTGPAGTHVSVALTAVGRSVPSGSTVPVPVALAIGAVALAAAVGAGLAVGRRRPPPAPPLFARTDD